MAYNVQRITQNKSVFQLDVYEYGVPRITEVFAESAIEAVARASDSLSPVSASHGALITNPRKSAVPSGH